MKVIVIPLILALTLSQTAPEQHFYDRPDAWKEELFPSHRVDFWNRVFTEQGYKLETIVPHMQTRVFTACHQQAIEQEVPKYNIHSLENYNLMFGKNDGEIYLQFLVKVVPIAGVGITLAPYPSFKCIYDIKTGIIKELQIDR